MGQFCYLEIAVLKEKTETEKVKTEKAPQILEVAEKVVDIPSPPKFSPSSPEPRQEKKKKGDAIDNTITPKVSLLDSLRPKHSIFCLKCRQNYPCHKFWFSISTVLCPECASKMTDREIELYNLACRTKPSMEERARQKNNKPLPDSTDDILTSVAPINSGTLSRMSKSMLKEEVAKGRLSETRYRIEMRRRQRPEAYNELPDLGREMTDMIFS